MPDVFLPLVLEGQLLLIESRYVGEILGSVTTTAVPHASLRLPGVFAYGHRAVPVIDLCALLELPTPGQRIRQRTVILRVGQETVGAHADEVLEVVQLSAADLRPPHVLPGPYRRAESPLRGRTAIVVDIERLIDDCLPEAG